MLCRIYDSIHAHEIKIEAGKKTLQRRPSVEGTSRKAERFEREMKKVVHTSVEMIRAVAQAHQHPTFYFGGNDFKMSRFMRSRRSAANSKVTNRLPALGKSSPPAPCRAMSLAPPTTSL